MFIVAHGQSFAILQVLACCRPAEVDRVEHFRDDLQHSSGHIRPGEMMASRSSPPEGRTPGEHRGGSNAVAATATSGRLSTM